MAFLIAGPIGRSSVFLCIRESYETREGEKRTVYEIEVDDVGPSLRNASAKVTEASRTGAPAGAGAQSVRGEGFGDSDPWAAGSSDEPPF